MWKKGLLARAPFAVTYRQQVAAGSLLTTVGIFTNPTANGGEVYEVLGVDYSYDVASTSGTLDVRNVPTAAAFTGGTSLLAATEDLSATARVARKATMASSATTRQIKAGSHISLILAGTLTNLVGFSVTVWLQAMRGIRAR